MNLQPERIMHSSSGSPVPALWYIQLGTIELSIMNRMSLVEFTNINQQEALTVANEMKNYLETLSNIPSSPIENQIEWLNKQVTNPGVTIEERNERIKELLKERKELS